MTDLTPVDKRNLVQFLSTCYDIEPGDIDQFVDGDSLPDNPRELPFVKDKIIYNNDEVAVTLSAEFYARVQYIQDLIKLNLDNPPGFRDGYIDQINLLDEKERKARKNPNLVTRGLVDDQEYDSLLSRIKDQVEFLESEIESTDMPEVVRVQLYTMTALLKYSIDSGSGADIMNGFKPLKYLCANRKIADGRQNHAYSKLGSKLDFMFDDHDTIAGKLLPYYNYNVRSLVNTIEKSLQEEF